MKRNAKILLLVLSLALIACAFAFGISAEDEGSLPTLANDHQFRYQIRYEYSDGTSTEYGDEVLVGNDLRLFLKDKCGVDKHDNKTLTATYVKLFSDATVYTKTQYDGNSITDVTSGWMVNSFKKPVTLDLGGHTLTMNEGTNWSASGTLAPFYCNGIGQAFTIAGSGTINTSGIQPFTANQGIFNILGDENKILINVDAPSSSVFNANNGGTINLKNVDVRLTGGTSVSFINALGKFETQMSGDKITQKAYTTDGTFTAEDCIFIDDRDSNNNNFIKAAHHPYVELKDCFVLTRATNFFTISSNFSYDLDTDGDGDKEKTYPTDIGKTDGYLMEQEGREGVLVLDNTQVYAPKGRLINEGTTTIEGGEPAGEKDPCRIVLKNGTTYSVKEANSIKDSSRLSIPDTTANNLGYLDVSAYHAGLSGDFDSSYLTAGNHVILLTDATLKYKHNAGTDTSLPPDQIISIGDATINLNGKTLNLNQPRHANYGVLIRGNMSFVGTGTINVEHNVFQQSSGGILNITGDSAQNPITINYVASQNGRLFHNWYGTENNTGATNLKYVNINVTSSGTSLKDDIIIGNVGRNDSKHNKPYSSFTAENCNFKVDDKGGTATPKALFYGANTTSFVLKNCNIEDSSANTFLFEENNYSYTRTDESSGTTYNTYAPFGNNPLYGCVIDIDGTTITNTAGNLITDNTKISEDAIVKIRNNSTITAAGKIIVFTTNDSGDTTSPDDLKIYFGTDGDATDKVTLRLPKGEENLSQNKSETVEEIIGLENVIFVDTDVNFYDENKDGGFIEFLQKVQGNKKPIVLMSDATVDYQEREDFDKEYMAANPGATAVNYDTFKTLIALNAVIDLNGYTLNLTDNAQEKTDDHSWAWYISSGMTVKGTGAINLTYNHFNPVRGAYFELLGTDPENPIVVNMSGEGGDILVHSNGGSRVKIENVIINSEASAAGALFNIQARADNTKYKANSFTMNNVKINDTYTGTTSTASSIVRINGIADANITNCEINTNRTSVFVVQTKGGSGNVAVAAHEGKDCVLNVSDTSIVNSGVNGVIVYDNTNDKAGIQTNEASLYFGNNTTIKAAGVVFQFATLNKIKVVLGKDADALLDKDADALKVSYPGDDKFTQNDATPSLVTLGSGCTLVNINELPIAYYYSDGTVEVGTISAGAATKISRPDSIDLAGNLSAYTWDLASVPFAYEALEKDAEGRIKVTELIVVKFVAFAFIDNATGDVYAYGNNSDDLKLVIAQKDANGQLDNSKIRNNSTLRFFGDTFVYDDKSNEDGISISNRKLDVDFNGVHVKTNGFWFIQANVGADVTVYTSKHGAIYQSGRIEGGAMKGAAMIIADARSADTKTYITINGNGLTVSGASVIESNQSSEIKNNQVYINVTGGTYIKSISDNGSPFATKQDVAEFNITGATIINNHGGACFASTHAGDVNFVIKDCVIISNNNGAVFNLAAGSTADMTATLENCKIHGKIGVTPIEDHVGTITLIGDNNYFTGTTGEATSLVYKANATAEEEAFAKPSKASDIPTSNYAHYGKDAFGSDFAVTAVPYFTPNTEKTAVMTKYIFIYAPGTTEDDYNEGDLIVGTRLTLAVSNYRTGKTIHHVTFKDGNGGAVTGVTTYYADGAQLELPTSTVANKTDAAWIYELTPAQNPWAGVDTDAPVTASVTYTAQYSDNKVIKADAIKSKATIKMESGVGIYILIPSKYAKLADVTMTVNGLDAKDFAQTNGYFYFGNNVRGILEANDALELEVAYAQGDFTWTASYKIDLATYCKAGLAQFGADKETYAKEYAVLQNLVNYVQDSYAYAEKELADLNDAVEAKDYDLAEADETNASALAGKLSVAVELGNAPKFVFKNVSGAELALSITYTSLNDGEVTATKTLAAGETFVLAPMAFDFAQMLNITADGATGTFNLAKYCNDTIADANSSDELKALCQSIYNYVMAAAEYKA